MEQGLRSLMIVGGQWGDEGKGKVVDLLPGALRRRGPLQRRPQRRAHRALSPTAASRSTWSPPASSTPAAAATSATGMVIDPSRCSTS